MTPVETMRKKKNELRAKRDALKKRISTFEKPKYISLNNLELYKQKVLRLEEIASKIDSDLAVAEPKAYYDY